MTATQYNKAVKNASSLEALRDLLNDVDELVGEDEREFALSGNELSELPTFGGKTPRNTSEVWSWDAKHILTNDGSWTVEDRCSCGEPSFHCDCEEAS